MSRSYKKFIVCKDQNSKFGKRSAGRAVRQKKMCRTARNSNGIIAVGTSAIIVQKSGFTLPRNFAEIGMTKPTRILNGCETDFVHGKKRTGIGCGGTE